MAHIHELIDFVVTAFIVHKNKVLLIHHKQLGVWLPIGGHIELNEDPEQALLREIKEECGLKVKILSSKPTKINSREIKFLLTPNFLDIHKISNKHRHIGLTYFAVSKSNKVKFNKAEHNDIKWFSIKDLIKIKTNTKPNVIFYAKAALAAAKKYK